MPSSSRSSINIEKKCKRHTNRDGFNSHAMFDMSVFRIIGFFMFQHGFCTQSIHKCRFPRYREALPHAQQALALFQSAGHDTGRARALNAVGWFHAQLGDYQQAIVCCQQALDLQREIDDHFGLAETYDSLGYAHRHLGHQKEATTCYQQAIDLYGELGDRYSEADTLVSLGDAHQAFGDSASARISWQRALTILEQLDHPRALGVRAKIYEDSEYITPARSQVTGWPTRLLQAPHLYRDLGDDIG